jgi:predicted transposase/invertase (TIGR01784 family)
MSALKDRYINPLTDFGFKRLFGSEPNKILLIDFPNQVLPERHQIEDLSYARSERLGPGELDRKAIFDLYCIGASGERFIVEIQKAKHNFFKERSVYYAFFPIQEQAQKGEWNYQLEPVYTVGILDFIFEDHKSEEELLHLAELKNQRCEVFYDKLKFVYIELPKFRKREEELETQFDKWLYVFRHLSQLQGRPQKLQDRVLQRLFEAAEIAKFSPEEREAYKDSLKHYRDLKNVVDSSREEGVLEGMEIGMEKVMGIGIEKGMELGMEKVREQQNAEIARRMKARGLPEADIRELTGLSAEEIEAL